jgi:hypothetical protein
MRKVFAETASTINVQMQGAMDFTRTRRTVAKAAFDDCLNCCLHYIIGTV